MAEVPATRDRADELVSQGQQATKEAAVPPATLAAIVTQWQQSIGNRGVAQMSVISDAGQNEAAPGGAGGAGGAATVGAGARTGSNDGADDGRAPGDGDGAGAGGESAPASAAGVAAAPVRGVPSAATGPSSAAVQLDAGSAGDGQVPAAGHTDSSPAPAGAPIGGASTSASAPGASSGAPTNGAATPAVAQSPTVESPAPDQPSSGIISSVGGFFAGIGSGIAGLFSSTPTSEPTSAPTTDAPTVGQEATPTATQSSPAAASPMPGSRPEPPEIEMPAVDARRPRSGSGPEPPEIEMPATSANGQGPHANGPAAPGATSPTVGGASGTSAADVTKPGFNERSAALKGNPPARPAAAHARGGGGGARHAKHQSPAKAPKPSLGDPALDKWKAAVGAGTEAVKPADNPVLQTGPAAVTQKGTDIASGRKAGVVDPTIDAKAHQPPIPKEEPKAQRLNTTDADAVIAATAKAADRHLTDQAFSPVGSPPAYDAVPLAPADFVPKTLRTDQAALELQLAGVLKDESQRPLLTKQLEGLKTRIAAIENNAGKGTPAEPILPMHDEGPASLTPPDPAMGDVLGDAIARASVHIPSKSKEFTDAALKMAHGSSVPKMIAMAKTEEETLASELKTELDGIALAAGVSKEQLDTKIKEQTTVVLTQSMGAAAAVQMAAAVTLATRTEQTKQEGEAVAGAKEAVKKDIEDKQAAAEGPPLTEEIDAKRDELLTKLSSTGGTAYGALQASLTKRLAELEAGATEKKQKATQLANTQAGAIRRHWSADPEPNKGMVEARPTSEWGMAENARVDAELARLKAAATAEHDAFAQGVTTHLSTGKEQIRDWAARQEGRERGFWERLLDMFHDWGKQASANNEAWEKQRNAESRDAMSKDLSVLVDMKQAQLDQNQGHFTSAIKQLSGEQQELAMKYIHGGIDSIGFVAESQMMRIGNRRKPEIAKSFEEHAIAEWDWESLGDLARATNPGFQPLVAANKIHAGLDHHFHFRLEQSKIYEGLGAAKTPVERASLEKCYQKTFDSSMMERIHEMMNEREVDRAEGMMKGDAALADAATIAEAIDGLGTDEKAIREALRGKSIEELDAIKRVYKEKYGVDMKADIRGDEGGAELENALALADGDVDKADAAELEDAMDGPGTDEEKMNKVYERIREEEERYAMQHGLTKPELEKRIKDRNARVNTKYTELGYGDLKKNATEELDDGDALQANNADNKLFSALMEGDEDKADAAKALVEREGVYTSDDKVEDIVRNQRKKAEFEVGLEDADAKAKLLAAAENNDIDKDAYLAQMKQFDYSKKPENEANRAAHDKRLLDKGTANVEKLKSGYKDIANSPGAENLGGDETFDKLVSEGTGGHTQDAINELLQQGGHLSDSQEIYYSIAGPGTNEQRLKDTLKGKTPAEIDVIRKKYNADHGDDSFDDDILGDLSGREDLDVGLTLKYGDPSTFAEQLAAAKPAERAALLANFKDYLKRRTDFERTGSVGNAMAVTGDDMNSSAQIKQAIERAEEYDKALSAAESKPGYNPAMRDQIPEVMAAQANFDMNFQGAVQAQEEVREQIDSFTNIAAQVGAAVVGIAVTIATLGAAGPVLAGVYAAAASAAASIAIKASMKGAAYGWEDLGTDVAVGTIDAAVSYATFGFGKGVTATVERLVLEETATLALEQGAEKVTESAVRTFIRESIEEGIQNGVQAIPSAFASNIMHGDDLWDSVKGAGMAGVQGAGVGMGIHAVKTGGGAIVKGIKGKLGSEPNVESKGGGTSSEGGSEGTTDGSISNGEAGAKPTLPHEVAPEQVLPNIANPDVTLPIAEGGELPPGAHVDEAAIKKAHADARAAGLEHDGGGAHETEGTGPHGNAPEPHAAEPSEGAPEGTPDTASDVEPTGAVEPTTKPGGTRPSPDDVGKILSEDDLVKRYGMPMKNVNKIAAIATKNKVIVDLRPTTPYGEQMLEHGTGLPKPAAIKAKTVNEADLMLGLSSKENLGKVGFFEPDMMRLPDNFQSLEKDVQQTLLKRMMQRRQEFAHYGEDMRLLQETNKIRIDPDGTVINTGLTEGKGNLPFVGDHDIMSIRQLDGRPVSPEVYKTVMKELENADVGVMHGAADNWKVDDAPTYGKGEALREMQVSHSVGGKEPLVRLGKGAPQAVWSEAYEIPEGTIFYTEGAGATNKAENLAYFEKLVAAEPKSEFALLRNEKTGEYMVMQGNGRMVPTNEARAMAGADPTHQKLISESIQQLTAEGPWVLDAHSHPTVNGSTPEFQRVASGGDADFGVAEHEVKRTGKAFSSDIHVTIEDGVKDVTRFGIEPSNKKPLFIEFTNSDGVKVYERFETIEDYHDWYAKEYGTKGSLGEIPDSFSMFRRKAPATTPPAELAPETLKDDTLSTFDDEPTLVDQKTPDFDREEPTIRDGKPPEFDAEPTVPDGNAPIREPSAGSPGVNDEIDIDDGTPSEPSMWDEQVAAAPARDEFELNEPGGFTSLNPDRTPIADPTNLPEYQQGITEASLAFERLPGGRGRKNTAGTAQGEANESGYSNNSPGYNDKPELNAKTAAAGVEAGHDVRGHVFDRSEAGRYENSHAERQTAVAHPGEPLASLLPLCPDCQRYFVALAALRETPIFVADPTGVHVFMPDRGHSVVPHPSGAVLVGPPQD